MAKATKPIDGHCVSCGRSVTGRPDRNGRLCCRSLACDALANWSPVEWRARAHSAFRAVPWRMGARVNVKVPGWCDCSGDPLPLGVWVIEQPDADGRAKLASACPKCRRVFGMWVDDPTKLGAGDVSRWLDFEARRRHLDCEDTPTWGMRSQLTDEPVMIEAPAAPPVETVAAAPAVADVLSLLVTPVKADEPAVEPVEAPPAAEVQSPVVEPAAPATPAVAAVAAVPAGPPICQLVGADSKLKVTLTRCGRQVTRKANDRLADHDITGWGSRVTCARCVTATQMMRAEPAA